MAGHRATYNDGRTAARLEVTVRLDLDGLAIAGPDGRWVVYTTWSDADFQRRFTGDAIYLAP